jgi:hypothetical protein
MWIIPSEITTALGKVGNLVDGIAEAEGGSEPKAQPAELNKPS